MKLTGLELQRSRGLDGSRLLQSLGPGFNIVVGSNGSGKSSLCRAIAGLMWETADFEGAVNGTWEVAGKTQHAVRESGAAPRWEAGGAPALPDARFRGCFTFSVDDFLNDQETDDEIQRVIRTELLAGFDLSKVLSGRRRYSPAASAVAKLKNELVDSSREVEQLREDHRELLLQESRLDDRLEQLEESKQARDRAGLLKDALELANKRLEWRDAQSKLADFPEGMSTLRADEQKHWDHCLAEVQKCESTLRDTLELETSARTDLAATSLATAIPKDQLQLLNRREELLRQLERSSHEACAKEALAVANLQESRAAIRGLVVQNDHPGESSGDRYSAVESLLASLVELDGKWAECLQRVEAGADGCVGPELEAPLAQGLTSLGSWLQSGGQSPAVKWVPGVLAGIGGVLLVSQLSGIGSVPLTIGSGALLLGCAGWMWKNLGGGEREVYQRQYSSLSLPLPDAWEAEAVSGRLAELVQELNEQDKRRASEQALQRDKRQLERIEEQRDELLERLNDFRREAQMLEGSSKLGLLEAAHQLKVYWEASHRLAEATAAKQEASVRIVRELAATLETLEPYGIEAVSDAEGVRAAAESLTEREGRRAIASTQLEQQGRLRAEAEDALLNSQKAKQQYLAARGVGEGGTRELMARLDRLADWQVASQDEDGMQREVLRLERRLDAHPDIVAYDLETAQRVLVENEAVAEMHGKWNDEVLELRLRLSNAREGHAVVDALADQERRKDALADVRDELLESAAADVLLDGVAQDHQSLAQPDILRSAAQLFAEFTRHRYELVGATYTEGSLPFEIREADGNTKLLSELSSGTRSQLGLALRFAVAQSVELDDPLPLILDEALTNSDPVRFRDVVRSLHQLVKQGRQIFFFTADPLDASRMEEVLKELDAEPAKRYDLDGISEVERASESLLTEAIPAIPGPLPGESVSDYGIRLNVPRIDSFAGVDALHLFYLCSHDVQALFEVLRERVETVGKARQLLENMPSLWDEAQRSSFEARRGVAAAWLDHYAVGRAPLLYPEVLREGPLGKSVYIEPLIEINEELGGDAKALIAALDVKPKDRDGRLKRFQKGKRNELLDDLEKRGLFTEDEVLDPGLRLERCLTAAGVYFDQGDLVREDVVQLVNAFEQWLG